MKKNILSAFFLSVISSVCFANNNQFEPNLDTPRSYSIEIQDFNHKTLYTTNINNISKTVQEKQINVTYVDNCLKNKGVVEATQAFAKTGFKISINEVENLGPSLIINMSQIVSKQKINLGDCFIEEVIIGSATITQNLPFISFEYKFHLNDGKGKDFNEFYYLKINGSKLKNN